MISNLSHIKNSNAIVCIITYFSCHSAARKEQHMKRLFTHIAILFATILLLSGDLLAQDVGCPSCSISMYWTGKTKTEWGKMFKLYKCPAQHAYWVPWETKKPKSYFDDGSTDWPYQYKNLNPSCPVCGMDASWTGKTRTEWGKLKKFYKCPAGHLSVGKF